MRVGHRLGGAAAGLGVSAALGWPLWQHAPAAVIGAVVAPWPDMDQRRWWRRMDAVLPDEILGQQGPLRHRGITHWWGVPVAGAIAAWMWLPSPVLWLAVSAVAGWLSHLALDFLFGKACPQEHRGPGIPLAPWWGHTGLGWDTDGLMESGKVTRRRLDGTKVERRVLPVTGPATALLAALVGLQVWFLITGT